MMIKVLRRAAFCIASSTASSVTPSKALVASSKTKTGVSVKGASNANALALDA